MIKITKSKETEDCKFFSNKVGMTYPKQQGGIAGLITPIILVIL
jgi:hypothetical protein